MKYEPTFHVVLHEPEIPQNTGNIGRTCVAIQAKLWLVQPLGFRIDQKSVRRAGLDYWPDLEWETVADWSELLGRLPQPSCWYFTKKAERLHYQAQYQTGDVLIFGSETRGLPDALLEAHRERTVRIPIRGPVRSLNLANAVAVAVYEAWRQTGWQSTRIP